MRWCRLYVETPSDPKLRRIAHVAGTTVSHCLAVWTSMLCHAASRQGQEWGTLAEWDDTDCAINLGIDAVIVFALRREMEGRLLDGKVILNWNKRQYDSDSAAERTRRWREKKTQQNQSASDAVTARDVTVTAKKRVEEKKEISAPSEPHPIADATGKRAAKQNPTKGFADFWRIYPRKIGKGAAEKAWPKALASCGGDPEPILMGIKLAVSLDRLDMREDGRFCPHASTWLNAKRWLDGMDAEPDHPTLFARHV